MRSLGNAERIALKKLKSGTKQGDDLFNKGVSQLTMDTLTNLGYARYTKGTDTYSITARGEGALG